MRGRRALVLGLVVGLATVVAGCLPNPDRVLARYQRDAAAYAATEAEAYGELWEAALASLLEEKVRAAVVFVASADATGEYHDLDAALAQAWSERWPGLVPLRTSRSAQDVLVIVQRPELEREDIASVPIQVFFSSRWRTYTVRVLRTAEGWRPAEQTPIESTDA